MLACVDLALLFGKLIEILVAGRKLAGVVLQKAFDITAFPVSAPGFDGSVQFVALFVPVIQREPLDRVADNDRGQTDLQIFGD